MRGKIAVVGAGVGGLSAAARLAARGYDVEVFEKLPRCGGRAHLIEDAGFKFDTGPSFVMMPDFFREVFTDCGRDIKDYLDLQVLDTHYKIFYADGTTLTVHRDQARKEQELEKIEPGSASACHRFIAETGRIYQAVEPLLYRMFTARDLFNPKYFSLAAKLKLGQTYWQLAKKYFKSEKLCYAFTFEAMFIGVSPFQTPAFYSVISYTDHAHKISHAMGGMYEIPRALEKMAVKSGAKFNYNTEVNSIVPRGNKFLLGRGKDTMEADKVVVGADYAYAQTELLGRKIPDYKYSCSVYLMYWGMKRKIPNLEHHNLFFARDLEANLANIFGQGRVGDDFSYYVHVPTVTDASLAPPGKDILYVLVPVPNLKVGAIHESPERDDFKRVEKKVRSTVVSRLDRLCGVNIADLIEVEHRFYPQDFIERYNVKYAATFGLAHNLRQSAFFRPPNCDFRFPGLYFCGASTQPGGGLPPVIASSRIAAEQIVRRE